MSDTTIVTGIYNSKTGMDLVFEIHSLDTKYKKLATDEKTYLVLINGKSDGISSFIPPQRKHLGGIGFEITQSELENFQTNIIDKDVTWSLTYTIELPGKWRTGTLPSGGSKKSRKKKSRKFRKSRKSRR